MVDDGHQLDQVLGIRAGEQLNDQGVTYRVKKSSDEWQQELVGEAYYVLRQKGTERPGTGEYNKFYPTEGHFVCAAPSCAQPLGPLPRPFPPSSAPGLPP